MVRGKSRCQLCKMVLDALELLHNTSGISGKGGGTRRHLVRSFRPGIARVLEGFFELVYAAPLGLAAVLELEDCVVQRLQVLLARGTGGRKCLLAFSRLALLLGAVLEMLYNARVLVAALDALLARDLAAAADLAVPVQKSVRERHGMAWQDGHTNRQWVQLRARRLRLREGSLVGAARATAAASGSQDGDDACRLATARGAAGCMGGAEPGGGTCGGGAAGLDDARADGGRWRKARSGTGWRAAGGVPEEVAEAGMLGLEPALGGGGYAARGGTRSRTDMAQGVGAEEAGRAACRPQRRVPAWPRGGGRRRRETGMVVLEGDARWEGAAGLLLGAGWAQAGCSHWRIIWLCRRLLTPGARWRQGENVRGRVPAPARSAAMRGPCDAGV